MDENLYDEKLFGEFFNEQPQALIWLQPVWSNNNIIDFVYTYGNSRGLQYLQLENIPLQNITIFNTPSLTDAMREKIFNEMVQVYKKGITSETLVYNPIIKRHGRVFRTRFRNGILNIIQDSTEETKAIQQLEKQAVELELQKSFSNSILDASPEGIFALEAQRDEDQKIIDFKIVKVNKAFTKFTNLTAADVEGKNYLTFFPSSIQAGTFAANCSVIESGEPLRKEMLYQGDNIDGWYDITMVKWGENGLVITFIDITQRKKSELEQQENTLLIQTMLNASFHGKALLEPITDTKGKVIDFKVVAANTATEKHLGIAPSFAVGKRLDELIPGYKKSGGFEKYKSVYLTSKSNRYEQFYQDNRLQAWFDIYLAPVKNGIVISFANITQRKQEALQLQQQKNLLDGILAHSPSGISVSEIIKDENNKVIDGRTIIANDAAIKYVGIPKDIYLSKTSKEIEPGIIESPLFAMAISTLQTGEPFQMQYFLEASQRWLELSVAKMDDEHLINVFTDITSSKEIQLQVEQFAEKLNTVIDTSQTGFFLGSPVYDKQEDLVDFRFTMVNKVMADFVGKPPKELIGELASDWFVAYKSNGLFERFKSTFINNQRQQFDMHYIGETVDVWANILTTRLGDELLGSFTDFTPIKKLQLQLEKSVEELSRSNNNLEEFAYAASHDLQEPLRKINFFSEQLRRDLDIQLTEENSKKFDRMQNATNRMRSLINDLLNYSKVSVKPDLYEDLELSDVVVQVLQDLEATIISTQAVVKVGKLPKIKGDERQLTQVFQNLISNAFKYRHPDVAPEVHISAETVNENADLFNLLTDVRRGRYHVIIVSDNGIGFEQKHAEKIFQVFQRLHGRTEYEGTGVGLAIVQKVITNHKGYIRAIGEPEKGATFYILLPI